MLFTYLYPTGHPLESLNNYLVQFLTAIRNVSANSPYSSNNFFHADFLIIVNRSPKLEEKLKNFFSSFKAISQERKDEFYNLVLKSQEIQNVFSDENVNFSDTLSLHVTQIIGNKTFHELVYHLFTVTLKTLNIKDHYKMIYDAMPFKVCPFCGVEKMHKTFQEDYDHLAAKKYYPILGIHMKNLAPMCHTCNSKNKGEKDVLHKDDGSRRLFIYPYSQSMNITIDFANCILPQTDENNINGNWNIELSPDNDLTQNWDIIFNIKTRYKEDYLESCYEDWLEDFLDGLKLSNIQMNNVQDVTNQLLIWSNTLTARKFYNLNFIKAPLFGFLANCGINSLYTSIILRYNQKLAA